MPATPGTTKATSCDGPAARKYSPYPTRNDAGTATLMSILAGSGSRPADGPVVSGCGAPGSVGLVGAPGATAPPSPIDGPTTTGKVMGVSGTAAAPASGSPCGRPRPARERKPRDGPRPARHRGDDGRWDGYPRHRFYARRRKLHGRWRVRATVRHVDGATIPIATRWRRFAGWLGAAGQSGQGVSVGGWSSVGVVVVGVVVVGVVGLRST